MRFHNGAMAKHPEPGTLGAVLREARNAASKRIEDVATAVGVTRQAVGQWELNETEPRLEKLNALGAYYGISVNDAMAGRLTYVDDTVTPPAQRQRAVAEYGVARETIPRTGPRDVPVFGFAVGGQRGEFHMNGEESDYAPRPPSLSQAKNVFAIYVFNDSMWPRFAPGDRLYVNPDRPPHIGDDVLVELHPAEGDRNGDAFIKRLVRRTAKEIICEQFNPAGEVVFERPRVRNLYRIVPMNELLGM